MSPVDAKIPLDEQARSINYNVDIDAVDDGAHPMGLAQAEAALQPVIDHTRNIPYAQGMASHVMLKDDPARQS